MALSTGAPAALFYACVVAYLMLGLSNLPFMWDLTPLRPVSFDDFPVTVGLYTVVCLCHGTLVFGFTQSIFSIAAIIGAVLICELYGTELFGDYSFVPGQLGPALFGELPVVVPFAWYATLYPSTVCAAVALRFPGSVRSITYKLITAMVWIIVAALFATGFDIISDPILAANGGHAKWKVASAQLLPKHLAAGGDIVWHTDRIPTDMLFMGVPLTNFSGWVFTCALGFLIQRLLCGDQICTYDASVFKALDERKPFWVQRVIIDLTLLVVYMGTGVFYAMHSSHAPVTRMLAVFLTVAPGFLAVFSLGASRFASANAIVSKKTV